MVADEGRVSPNAVLADLVQVGFGCLLAVTSLLAPRLVLVPRARLVDRVVERANLGVLGDLHLELRLGETQQNLGPAWVIVRAVLHESLKNGDLPLEQVLSPRACLLPSEPSAQVDLERRAGRTLLLGLLRLGRLHARDRRIAPLFRHFLPRSSRTRRDRSLRARRNAHRGSTHRRLFRRCFAPHHHREQSAKEARCVLRFC
jgi:hypothetical protein